MTLLLGLGLGLGLSLGPPTTPSSHHPASLFSRIFKYEKKTPTTTLKFLNSWNLCEVSNSLALSGSPGPSRRVPGVPPVPGETAGLRRLQREDPGPLHAPGAGPLLARGLPQVRLLRLPAGPAGLHPLHPGQPHPLPQGLPQVSPVRKKLPTNHGLLF